MLKKYFFEQLKDSGAEEVVVLHVIDEKKPHMLSGGPDQYLKITTEMEEAIATNMVALRADFAESGFRVPSPRQPRLADYI